MLAYHRIKLLDFHFLGHGALVFSRGIEVTSACTETSLILSRIFCSYGPWPVSFESTGETRSDSLAATAHFCKNGVYAFLVDDSHAFGRHSKFHEALFCFNPELVGVKIRQEPSSGSIFCVRDVVAAHWTFAGHLAYSGHVLCSALTFNTQNRLLYEELQLFPILFSKSQDQKGFIRSDSPTIWPFCAC